MSESYCAQRVDNTPAPKSTNQAQAGGLTRPDRASFREDASLLTAKYGAELHRFIYWPTQCGFQLPDVDGQAVEFLRELLGGGDEARIVAALESYVLMTGKRYEALRCAT